MPVNGKKSLTLYTTTVETLGRKKEYGETWDAFLLDLLDTSGRVKKHTSKKSTKGRGEKAKGQNGTNI